MLLSSYCPDTGITQQPGDTGPLCKWSTHSQTLGTEDCTRTQARVTTYLSTDTRLHCLIITAAWPPIGWDTLANGRVSGSGAAPG